MSFLDEMHLETLELERLYYAEGSPMRQFTLLRQIVKAERVIDLISSYDCPMGRNVWLQRATDGVTGGRNMRYSWTVQTSDRTQRIANAAGF